MTASMRMLSCGALVLFALLAAVGTAQNPTTPAATQGPAGAKVVVIGDFGPEGPTAPATTLPNPGLPSGSAVPSQGGWAQIARTIIAEVADSMTHAFPKAAFASVTVVNTQGDLGNAVLSVVNALNAMGGSTPDVAIIADDFDISNAVQRVVIDRLGSSVAIIMARSSSTNPNFASPSIAPTTLRLVPSDAAAVTAVTGAVTAFGWQSVSLLYTGDDYGTSFVNGLSNSFDGLSNPPRVLGTEVLTAWSSPTRDDRDVASLVNLVRAGAVGVVAIGARGFSARVLNAVNRAIATEPAVKNLFFLFLSESLFDMPAGLDLGNCAFVIPRFMRRALSRSYPDAVVDPLAYVVSNVADALNVVGFATDAVLSNGQFLNGQTIFGRAVQATITEDIGATGAISFNPTTFNRNQCEFQIWRPAPVQNFAAVKIATVLCGAVTIHVPNLVPRSINNVVEICLIGSDSCSDMANVAHALMALLDANAGNVVDTSAPQLPKGITLKPVALAAGTIGVRAIAAVSKNAKTCDFIIGPSRTSLVVAINPLISFYAIPTLDYGSTSTALSDKLTYPYFTRTVPTDTKSTAAVAATYSYMGWDSVAMITTKDTYGSSLYQDLTLSLNNRKISLENAYFIDSHADPASALRAALVSIKNELVTRVVFVALPWSDDMLRDFFHAIDEQDMTLSHLWTFADNVCQFTSVNTRFRDPLVGSICVVPQYDRSKYAAVYQRLVDAQSSQAQSILSQGGFDTATCGLARTDMYSAYAHDAAFAVIAAIKQMVVDNNGTLTSAKDPTAAIFSDGLKATYYLRSSQVTGYTGPVTFDLFGDRTHASFVTTVQQKDKGPVEYGVWLDTTGTFTPYPGVILVWGDNTTAVPKATTRGVGFIAAKTVATNPAMIVISVLGFIGTIGVLVFCFKYNSLKRRAAGIDEHNRSREDKQEMNSGRHSNAGSTSVRVDYSSKPQSRPQTPGSAVDRSA